MGLETASYISELVATNPDGADDYATTDDHFRLIKDVLQTQFPNFTAAAMNAAIADLNILAGADAAGLTAAEIVFMNGVTSGVQAQIDGKAPTAHSHTGGEISALDVADITTGVFAAAFIPNLDAGKITTGTFAAGRIPTHTGDVTGQTALTIANNAVTLTKLGDMNTNTFLGRDTGGTGDPEELSATQARGILGVEAGATADQSAAEIKSAYEANADTNAFTNVLLSKLNGVEADATADQSNAEIRTAVEAATNSNVFNDTDHSKLNGIENNATADQTAGQIEAIVSHDNLLGFVGNEHLRWDLTGAENIHADRYTNTVYTHPHHSGHVTSVNDGVQTLVIAAITGQTDIGANLIGTDEVIVNDGGAIRRADISRFNNYFNSNLSFAGTGHTHTGSTISDLAAGDTTSGTFLAGRIPTHTGHVIGQTALSLVIAAITGQTDIGADLVGTDEVIVNDGGVIRRADISRFNNYLNANLNFLSGSSVTKHKTADTASSTSTLVDDTHLSGWSLEASSYYKIEGYLMFSTTDAAADIDFRPGISSTPIDCWMQIQAVSDTGTLVGDSAQFSADIRPNLTLTTRYCGMISGFIETDAAPTFALQFARSGASNTVTLHDGSWMTITKL